MWMTVFGLFLLIFLLVNALYALYRGFSSQRKSSIDGHSKAHKWAQQPRIYHGIKGLSATRSHPQPDSKACCAPLSCNIDETPSPNRMATTSTGPFGCFTPALDPGNRITDAEPSNHCPSHRVLTYDDYTVGWICALPIEMATARVMLDEVHADLPVDPNDENAYILGRMSSHNIVIACLPAGIVGCLIVGIGGGVPSQVDIRLGDVVVAQPTKNHGGVVQYDYPRTIRESTVKKISSLNKPPRILLNALSKLQAIHLFNGSGIAGLLSDLETKYPLMASILQQRSQDRLFRADYHHRTEPTNVACGACDKSQVRPRPPRYGKARSGPCIHYGLIASGNEVVKDSGIRDHLARQSGILCFEMEAAGLMDDFPCLVIRGISDYADTHKNDTWQGYAAATAAAYAKELLSVIPTVLVENM